MGFPRFGSDVFRNAVLGAGALALVSLPAVSQEATRTATPPPVAAAAGATTLPPVPFGDEDLPVSQGRADFVKTGAAVVSATAEHSGPDLPELIPATEERPYAYMRFDGETARQLPNATPLMAMIENPDKLIVINFIDERNRFSAMQSQVLAQTLTALAPRSEAKELMLMDVVVRNQEGKDFYMSTYTTYYDDNNLGPNGARREDAVLPYGVVWGDPLREGSNDFTLFDFALMNGVQNDADLNANANAIAGSMYNVILNYNQKKLAALSPDRPTLASLE